MNNPNRIFAVGRLVIVILTMGLFFIGCASTEEKAAPPPEPQAAMPAPPPTPTAPEKRIMFDFDSAEVKPGFDQEIKAHIAYMKSNPSVNVAIEGHCDSHGPDAYNMALGGKRAEAVKAMMIQNGINENRIKVISYGESKPRAEGENRQAWAENRRVEFVYAQ